MKPKQRYETPPEISFARPTCSSCCVDLEADDGWTCPSCGTSWDAAAEDGATGQLYADWSGESVKHLPLVDHDEGWRIA